MLDPFNARTTNYLRLLDMMDQFASKESAHFIVRYDARQDPIIPEYFSDYLESVYPAVCGAYQYEPKVKTFIEVFPTHDAFSVRTTGGPWIATVGASTGRIIALVAPRKGERTMGPFNWSQVLRHEFTHTVTLGATDNRIAHWFTEGLAVQQEHSPLRWEWVPMLYSAVTKHELFQMDSLTWAFIRPRRPIDRQLAYAESSWICQFVEQRYGHGAILAMLDQFRKGSTQEEVFENALHRTQSEFFTEFERWCQKQVAGWGYDEASSAKYQLLRDRGEELIQAHEYARAVPIFEQIAALRPVDMLPHQRLAGLYMNGAVHDLKKAAEQLDILAAVELNNNMYTKGAGGCTGKSATWTKPPPARSRPSTSIRTTPTPIGCCSICMRNSPTPPAPRARCGSSANWNIGRRMLRIRIRPMRLLRRIRLPCGVNATQRR